MFLLYQPPCNTSTVASLLSEKIPPEIISEIFLQSIDQTRTIVFPCYDDHPTEPPFVFGLVCKDWRAVSLSTPSLWCNLEIRVIRREGVEVTKFADIWLARSGAMSLTLSLDALHFDLTTKDVKNWFFLILDSMLKVKPRLKGIKFRYLTSRQALELANQFSDAPTLEMFSAHVFVGTKQLEFALPPTLRHFSSQNWEPVPRFTPFGQQNLISFSTLFGTSISVQYVFSVIKNCPVLEDIEMEVRRLGRIDSDEMLSLPRLRRMRLVVLNTDILETVFPRISTSNLNILQLRAQHRHRDIPHESFLRDFIENSRPPLLHLQLLQISISDESLLSILPLLPQLRTLRLSGSSLSDTVIKALTYRTASYDRRPSESVLCPKLRAIAISHPLISTNFTSADVAEMIVSRNGSYNTDIDLDGSDQTVEHLKYAEFIGTVHPDEMLKDSRILSCIGDGLRLVLDFGKVIQFEELMAL